MKIHWYNRLAAWLHGTLGDWLVDLAMPVWQAEGEADWEEQMAEEERLAADDLWHIQADAYRTGYDDAEREYRERDL